MLIIGSLAMKHHGFNVEPKDIDYICTFEEFQGWCRDFKEIIRSCVPLDSSHFHVVTNEGRNMEFEIAWPGSSGDILLDRYGRKDGRTVRAPLEVLLALKLSHRYKKNSPHHHKTMRDIWKLRENGVELDRWLKDWLPLREKETYTNSLPKLNVSRVDFFDGDGINYIYDHDDLHRIVALSDKPAYMQYLKDGSEVLTSNEKFFSAPEEIRLLGGLEEALVLASERCLIPYNFSTSPSVAFKMALDKITTSITSGKFREFCWESYYGIEAMYYELDGGQYAEKVKEAVDNNSIKLFKGK